MKLKIETVLTGLLVGILLYCVYNQLFLVEGAEDGCPQNPDPNRCTGSDEKNCFNTSANVWACGVPEEGCKGSDLRWCGDGGGGSPSEDPDCPRMMEGRQNVNEVGDWCSELTETQCPTYYEKDGDGRASLCWLGESQQGEPRGCSTFNMEKGGTVVCNVSPPGPPTPPAPPPGPGTAAINYGMNLDNTTMGMGEPAMNLISGGVWPDGKIPKEQGTNSIKAVRLYDYRSGPTEGKAWTEFLIKNKIKVLIGIWASDEEAIENQINQLVDDYKNNIAGWDEYVMGISMGNEVNWEGNFSHYSSADIAVHLQTLQRHKLAGRLPPDALITSTLKASLNVANNPSGAWNIDQFEVGAYLKDIKAHIDVVSVNFYPYFSDSGATEEELLSVKAGNSFLHDQIAQVQYAMSNDRSGDLTNKKLWITETGWASPCCKQWANEDNWRKYYDNVLTQFPVGPNAIQGRNPGTAPRTANPEWIFYFAFRGTKGEPDNFGLIRG
jgi:exo-beta-1,3-glucanase (GH17 family)